MEGQVTTDELLNKVYIFTGPALDALGNKVVRQDLLDFCDTKGVLVADKIYQHNIEKQVMVFSRQDTVKYKEATQFGMACIPYSTFFKDVLGVVSIPASGAKPDKFTDVHPDELVPDFTVGTEWEVL